MNFSIESLSSVQKKITFEIPPERVGEEMEKAYRMFQPRARLKGFRSGKVPRSLLERHFGEQITADVSALLVEESYARAIKEYGLPVVTRPHIVTEKLIPGSPFRYSATVEVKPNVTVTDYENIEVEKRVRRVREDDVEAALGRLAESFAQLRSVTGRDTVVQGDMVSLDYVALRNGRPVAGLQGKNRLIEMGKETFFPGFQENLIGVRKQETVEFSLPVPAPDGSSDKDTSLLTFRVTVHDLAQKEIPVVDDEFAKDHGECATLEELRSKIRANLQRTEERRAESQMHDALISQILARNPFEVPPSLLREQMKQMLVEAGALRQEDDLAAGEAKLPESVREEVRARAQHQIKTIFLLDALVGQLDLSVSEEELQSRITEFAASGGERQQQIEAFYAKEENRQTLRDRLLREKSLQALVETAQVKTVEEDVAGGEEKD